MISGSNPCFPNVPSQAQQQMYNISHEDIVSSSLEANSSGSESHASSLLYSFSILKEKIQQVQSLVGILISPDQTHPPESTSLAVASMGTLIQEIIINASSMMFTCQQMAIGASGSNSASVESSNHPHHRLQFPESGFPQLMNFGSSSGGNIGHERGQSFHHGNLDWYGSSIDNSSTKISEGNRVIQVGPSDGKGKRREVGQETEGPSTNKDYDIIELDAADLLAKYTHYCQVCGKGFKRDANLRMHMRAHGDEYKSSAALSNPMKKNGNLTGNEQETSIKFPRKYSCPQEGCRWNQKHAKFQPLKSIICVKNHYKRSHCPKMYVCKRCNRKQFSVLSDLRTHEKHCGNLKWQCSCGTTFSRKDKLMGHVALFVGHSPAINSAFLKSGNYTASNANAD